MSQNFTPNEMMTVAAARALTNQDVCFVGIGAPSAACNLARQRQTLFGDLKIGLRTLNVDVGNFYIME